MSRKLSTFCRGLFNILPTGLTSGRLYRKKSPGVQKDRICEAREKSILRLRSGQTFYDACQVPCLFFYAAWRIFCRAIFAK